MYDLYANTNDFQIKKISLCDVQGYNDYLNEMKKNEKFTL